MFIMPPYIGNGVRIRVKERCQRLARDVSGFQAIAVWSALVVLGLAIAALLAWLLSA